MTRALVALVALALALPVAALAQAPQTNAPPGNSAIDEYLETIPGATGSGRPRPPAASGKDSVLTPAERRRLEQLGPDGKTLADAVERTAPAASSKGSGKAAEPAGTGRSPIGGVVDALGGSDAGGGGMGLALPAILLGSLLGAVALVLLRRRAAS